MRNRPTILELRRRHSAAVRLQPELRIPFFLDAPIAPVKALSSLHLAFIGLGSVGLNAALHAGRMGVGTMLLCDSGVLKPESMITHPLLAPASGMAKALFAGRVCQAINPSALVRVFVGPVQQLPIASLAHVDAVILATDHPAPEAFTGQLCQRFRRPLIHCSVHGETLVAHARFFANTAPGSPCPACLFGDAEMRQLHSAARFACDGSSAEPPTPATKNTPPTMSVSHLCAQAACLGINLLIRHVLALGDPVTDTLVEYCGYTDRCVTAKLRRSANCPCDHTPFERSELAHPIADTSPRVLAETAGFATAMSWEALTFEIGGHTWLESARCRCTMPRPVRRFVASAGKPWPRCRRCGQRATLQPFFSHQAVAAGALRPFFDHPLRKLGATHAEWVVIRNGVRSVFIQQPTESKS